MKATIPPIQVVDQTLGRVTYEAFENEMDLCCLARLEIDGRAVGAIVLNKGDLADEAKYQIIFAFSLNGIHPQLSEEEALAQASGIAEAMKILPQGERCTFMMGCYSDDRSRQGYLSQLVETSPLALPAVLLQNEQQRVRQLTHKGLRQHWEQTIFCTWSADEYAQTKKDPISNLIYAVVKGGQFFFDTLLGKLSQRQEQLLYRLLERSYVEGFLPWEMRLATQTGLEVSALGETDLWRWLWRRFNSGAAPAIPQLLVFSDKQASSGFGVGNQESAVGNQESGIGIKDASSTPYSLFPTPSNPMNGQSIKEIKTSDFHGATVLIQGEKGRSSCPEHRQSPAKVFLRDKICGVMVMVQPIKAWTDVHHQLAWIWQILSQSQVQDTEIWVEVSPSVRFWVEESLHRQAKQSKAQRERAALKGTGRDVGAEIKAEEAWEAQKEIYKGAMPLHCAVAFLVYRDNSRELDRGCELLSHSFGAAKVVRERNIASQIWLETLPITWRRLLHSSSLLSERRLTLQNTTVAGVLPLTCPKHLDAKGVEFLSEPGGKSVCVDLFSQTQHALVTGMTGSGKSVLLWRFMLDALSRGIPVVGMDFPAADGESSFKTGIEMLGEAGAYFDISRASSNLIEPPDLRCFKPSERKQRMKNWKDFIREVLALIVMGKVSTPHLAQRVDALLRLTFNVFLGDSDIIERYNLAFENGWKSPQWQDIPQLKDFVRYCTVARLNLKRPGDLDYQALNQITTQIEALLASPLGEALGKPSSFSPDPLLKFFALTGINNDSDAYIMALNTKAACVRVALSHPKSLFVGDELSVLCRKEGFSTMLGNLAATARKDGLSLLLSTQDPDTICTSVAAAMIMQNLSYRITGKITANACSSFTRYLGYPLETIGQNASDTYKPSAAELYSCWLVEKYGRFWPTRFYPGEMVLASLANNQEERRARQRVLAQYPNDVKGQLMGLAHFTREYIPALKDGRGFEEIGKTASQGQKLQGKRRKANSADGNGYGGRSDHEIISSVS